MSNQTNKVPCSHFCPEILTGGIKDNYTGIKTYSINCIFCDLPESQHQALSPQSYYGSDQPSGVDELLVGIKHA